MLYEILPLPLAVLLEDFHHVPLGCFIEMDCLCIVTTKQSHTRCPAHKCSVESPGWLPIQHPT
ncbi:hypothetical protein JRQ81_019546, partial [Phrynocephalus forsythii]